MPETKNIRTAHFLPEFEPLTSHKIDIQFINQLSKNILLEDAPDAPQLVSISVERETGKVQPFLRKGIVGQLVGAGGIGKTHFLTQLALSIATGTTFLERYLIDKPGNVFLGLGENSDDDIHRLVRKTAMGMSSNFENFEKVFLDAATRLAVMSFAGKQASFVHENKPTDFYNDLLQALKINEPIDGWSLIILDPISRFLGSDAEKDNAAATMFISLLERFTLELKGNPTVLFGHHMSKSGVSNTNSDQTAARGSSALTDGVRWQANLDRVKRNDSDEYERDLVSFKVVKSNFTAITNLHVLKKDEVGYLSCNEQHSNSRNTLSARDLNRIKRKMHD